MENYFEIENLKCSYDKGRKVVLEIERLEIPRGKVVFIVGPSGCGKSTILETLGLMNNTLVVEKNTKFLFSSSGREAKAAALPVDCTEVWRKSNRFLSRLRRQNFSFIFQNTNLMENFSIRENAEISKRIKGGSKKYADVMREVELDQVLKKEKVGELSGGQKQRLAFVRAFLPDFNVLFGDEPTGNLDPENADKLIALIVKEIRTTDKTAIIVSHTPDLYNKYADIIITIQRKARENGEVYGLIDADSVKINNR